MTDPNRLPATVTFSMALHAGLLFAWLYSHQISPDANLRMISNVELMIPVKAPVPVEQAAKPKPLSTWNFLKMAALPTAPRPHISAPLEVKAPEQAKLKPLDTSKALEERRGRLSKAMEASLEDRGRHAALANLDTKIETHRNSAALGSAAILSEVGVRRASKSAIEMSALAEEHRGRMSAMTGQAIALPERARSSAAQAPILPDASPTPGNSGRMSRLSEMLTSEPLQSARPMGGGAIKPKIEMEAPVAPRKEAKSLEGGKKKAVEIEGPLSNRRIVHWEVPPFPSWAQGIIEAEVKIRFNVSPAGEVLSNMRIEQTSGDGRLDRLAMESLKRWRFQSIGEDAGNQWGVITFRFIVE